MSAFGEYLRELRGDRSLREIEKITGISHTYLSSLEKGYDPRSKKERKPTVEIIKKLSEHLPNASYAQLLKLAGYEELAIYERKLKELKEDFADEPDTHVLVSNHFLEKVKDLNELLTLNDYELKNKITPKYKGRELSTAEREQVLKMLEVLFPEA